MKRTILSVRDFEAQAAAILAASKTKWADAQMRANGEDVGGDDNDGAPGSDDDADDDKDDADDDAQSGDDDGDDKSGDDDKDEDDKVDRAEYERVKRHRAAADRKNADLQRQIDELKRGQKGDDGKDDKGKKDDTADSERERTREQEIYNLRIQNAFLAANDYSWHDAADALRLADLSDVEIEDDGTVVGLKEALQKLAKDKPFLLKKADSEPPKGKSGSSTNGKRKGGTNKPDRAALSRTYPVLAARR